MSEYSDAMRSLAGRVGAHESWARTVDRTARTAPAREKFEARFANENERKAYFARLALKSAQARSRNSAARLQAEELRRMAAEALEVADEIEAG
jgi:hypothetical protein